MNWSNSAQFRAWTRGSIFISPVYDERGFIRPLFLLVIQYISIKLFHIFIIWYICNSQKYFVWLSVYYMKLAWEWATDKKNANCLESLYSSCCQITLYLSAKIMFFLWIPEFSGYNLHGDFKNNPNQEWHLYRSRVHVTHRQR